MAIYLRHTLLKGGVKSLYLDYGYIAGKRKRETLEIYLYPGETDANRVKMDAARQLKKQRDVEAVYIDHNLTNPELHRSCFFIYYHQWLEHYPKADKRMYIALQHKLKDFHAKEILPCNNINDNFIKKFIDYLTAPKIPLKKDGSNTTQIKKSTANLTGSSPSDYFKKFKHIIKDATSDGYFRTNPTERIFLKNEYANELRKAWLNEHQMQQLVNTPYPPNPEVRRMFLTATQTGMPYAESQKLQELHIDTQLNIVDFSRNKTDKKYTFNLNASALALIGPLTGNPHQYIFQRITIANYNKHLKKWMALAGINKHITSHCARHSAVTNLLLNEVPDRFVSAAVGHTSSKSIRKYDHVTLAVLKQSFNFLPTIQVQTTSEATSQ